MIAPDDPRVDLIAPLVSKYFSARLPMSSASHATVSGRRRMAREVLELLGQHSPGQRAEPELTERQAAELPIIFRRLAEYGVEGITSRRDLNFTFKDEIRPGRGHAVRFSAVTSDHAVCGSMDVYGYADIAIAEITLVHADGDDECRCDPCRRMYDLADEPPPTRPARRSVVTVETSGGVL